MSWWKPIASAVRRPRRLSFVCRDCGHTLRPRKGDPAADCARCGKPLYSPTPMLSPAGAALIIAAMVALVIAVEVARLLYIHD